MTSKINQTVLMSGADYFGVIDMNPFAHGITGADRHMAERDFQTIRAALDSVGFDVIKVDAPADCQDGIFTANWGLCRGDTAVLSRLPNVRQAEEAYAEQILRGLGKKTIKAPYRFSGQGDALPCGNYLFCGTGYRNDPRIHQFLADTLGYDVISLQTIPELDDRGQPVINNLTGWPDSFFYDIDLALAVLRPGLIVWCPEAFTLGSQAALRALKDVEKIEVSIDEAMHGFACNLLSNGSTVVMSSKAPQLQAAIESYGFKTVTPEVNELSKAGGFIRCTTLTLDNA